VNLAQAFAIENPHIQAEVVEAIEFPDLANQYHVSGVPQTTVNHGAETIVGTCPEEDLVATISQVLQK
jgi:hypothetical protein